VEEIFARVDRNIGCFCSLTSELFVSLMFKPNAFHHATLMPFDQEPFPKRIAEYRYHDKDCGYCQKGVPESAADRHGRSPP
jgi:hypothetical protein